MSAQVLRHRLENSPADILWQKYENAQKWEKRWEGTPQGQTWRSRVYTFRVLLRKLGELS